MGIKPSKYGGNIAICLYKSIQPYKSTAYENSLTIQYVTPLLFLNFREILRTNHHWIHEFLSIREFIIGF